MGRYKPIPYTFDRDDEVIALLDRVFSPWAGDKAYFNWKYKDYSPDGCDFPRAWIIEEDNKIIAFNGYLPRQICLKGKKFWGLQSFDTVTHPDCMGKGLFGILQNEVYREMQSAGISWVYGWTSDIGFKVFTGKMGWQVWGRQRYLMKVLDTNDFANEKISNRFLSKIVAPGLKLWNIMTHTSKSKIFMLESVDRLSKSYTPMMATASKRFKMIALRDTDYINWRASNPIENSNLLAAKTKNDEPAGYAAVNYRDGCLDIDDCLAISPSAILALVAGIEARAISLKCRMIRFRINEAHPWIGYFRRAGYFMSNTQFPLLGKKLLDDGFTPDTQDLNWSFFDRNE